MRIGSLFSGIGGLELGLERAGLGHTVWQVEQSEFCRGVLAKHWPHAQRYEDVKQVGRDTLEQVDLICGGFPCQDVSSAGKGKGLSGERSGLWYQFARIIGELRPEWVVVENVASGAKKWSTPWCLSWDSSAMKRYRSLCRQKMSALRISGDVSFSLPTPSASRYGSNQGGAAGRKGKVRHSLDSLAKLGRLPTPTETANQLSPSMTKWPGCRKLQELARLPTPAARDYKGPSPRAESNNGRCLPGALGQTTRCLSPLFVEWMMGFEPDHTKS